MGHIAYMDKIRNACKIIARKPKGKLPRGCSVNCGTSQRLQEPPPLYLCNSVTLKYIAVQKSL